ncbi:MAG: alpha/beta hydrolase [Actinomycetota bacterium]|nr:alpha/beta hydrolase [Actinomycetota bacterium]
MTLRRAYVDVDWGQVHVTSAGASAPGALPVVGLHQTPRSWDELREVLGVLGRSRLALAPDLPGMGGSDDHPDGASIASYAAGVVDALDALGIDRFDLVGHHTGGVVAVEIAASHPGRVRRLVLSSTPWVDAANRAKRVDRPPIDAVEVRPDGSHLTELWQRRQRFYPPERPDILVRFVRDALRATDPEEGHRAVGRYRMEERIDAVAADVLVVGHDADPYAFGELEPLAAALGGAPTAVVAGGMVPLELRAEAFAAIVERFLDGDAG